MPTEGGIDAEVRAFDDSRQTFVEFPASIGVGEAPPLFVIGEQGDAQLVNCRMSGRFYVVDRLASRAFGARTASTDVNAAIEAAPRSTARIVGTDIPARMAMACWVILR